jgi:hypothetical protein
MAPGAGVTLGAGMAAGADVAADTGVVSDGGAAGGGAAGGGAAVAATGWEPITGPEGTGCLDGSGYAFFVRHADPGRLVIYFDGGGACWNGDNCDLEGRPTATARIQSRQHPAPGSGIFDFASPRNPLRDFTVVFVPYCTGDVHLGTRSVVYTSPHRRSRHRTFEVRHQGAANATAVLDWVFARFEAPELVFVTGSSAGAIPTPLHASRVARRYPEARVVQLGDAAGGYRTEAVPRLLDGWGASDWLRRLPGYRSFDPASLTFETLYVVAARETPRVTFSQFNCVEDATQELFLKLVGMRGPHLPVLLKANLEDLRRSLGAFRSFTAPGSLHAILPRPEFYSLSVDGVAFRDWMTALLDGKPVENVGDDLL